MVALCRLWFLKIMQKKTSDILKVVFLRHGESVWNQENRFTGWTDVGLSEKGIGEAREAGRRLKENGYKFDICFTSVLKRAIMTFNHAADVADMHYIPVIKHWRLNERSYGALQGLNKAETAAKHGDEQVLIWRRSYDIPPPELTIDDKRHPSFDPKYDNIPKDVLPLTESLKTTVDRVLPFWYDQIAPQILSGKRVLVTAHGNSLRAIVKHLSGMSEKDIINYNIPTGVPLVYEFDQDLKPIKNYYIASDEEIKAKMDAVAKQGVAKK